MQNKAIKKIIFLWENWFSERDYKRFGISLLNENGFEVEIWDITPMLHPDFLQKNITWNLVDYKAPKVFYKRKVLYERLTGLCQSDFVVNLVSYSLDTIGIYNALSKSGVYYAVFTANSIPFLLKEDSTTYHLFSERVKKVLTMGPFKMLKRLLAELPFSMFKIKPARLLLAGGEKSVKCRYPIDDNTETLYIHTLDYDIYLAHKNETCDIKPIAVFLDEFYPFHPDFSMMKSRPPVKAAEYYCLLNNFFDLVEKNTGLEVIIAAHPRSHYESMPDYFKGRKYVKGQTVNLVKECQLVLSHFSTAANFANLFCKPVTFLTCNDIDKSDQGSYIRAKAQLFGKKPIFMDMESNIDWKFELTVSEEHYKRYRISYIKTQASQDLPFWQIFSERIKRGFNGR